MRDQAVIYDLSGTFYAHWHASKGESISHARERTIRDVRRACALAKYSAVALDVRGTTFRHELSPLYKANRTERPEALFEELRKTEETLAREFHTFSCQGYEADDNIATLVSWLSDAAPGVDIVVHSGDKGLHALVSDTVSVVSTSTGVEYDVDAVRSRYGVLPYQMSDFLAIRGDTSDNIPGVKGIGDMLAAALLSKFKTVAGVAYAVERNITAVNDVPKLGPAKAKALIDAVNDGSLALSLELTTLFHSVAIDCERILTTKEYEPETAMPERPFAPSTAPKPAPTQPSSAPAEVLDAEVVSSRPAFAKTTALAKTRTEDFTGALEPHDLDSAFTLAEVVVNSRLFDAYSGSKEAVLLTIMAGREMGLGAMASLRTFHIVEGKPTMSAQLMMAICLASPLCEEFRVLRSQCSKNRAVVRVRRHGWSDHEDYEWTAEDAEDAGLAGKNNWAKYARAMLINRAISEAAKFAFPELMANVYTPSEVNPNHMAMEVAA